VQIGNVLAILGLVFLVPAMVGVLFVITDLIFGMVAAIVTTALVALGFVLLWFVLPYLYPDNDD
jgi:hypothetical protein